MKNILIARFVGTTMSIPEPDNEMFKVLAVGTQAAMQGQAMRLNAAITAPDTALAQAFKELVGTEQVLADIEFAAVECIDSVAVDDTVQIAQGLLQRYVAPQMPAPMMATTKASSTVAAPAPHRRLGKSRK